MKSFLHSERPYTIFPWSLCGLSGSVISVIEGVKVGGIKVRQHAGARLAAINSRPNLTKRIGKFVFFGQH